MISVPPSSSSLLIFLLLLLLPTSLPARSSGRDDTNERGASRNIVERFVFREARMQGDGGVASASSRGRRRGRRDDLPSRKFGTATSDGKDDEEDRDRRRRRCSSSSSSPRDNELRRRRRRRRDHRYPQWRWRHGRRWELPFLSRKKVKVGGGRRDEMRRAYRMAILASLAYHDFRDDDDDDDDDGHHHHHHHHPNGNERDTETTSRVGGGGSGNSSWRSFALVDDPIPSNYLAKMTGYDHDDEMTSTRGGIGTTSSSMERTRDKKRKWDRIRRISSGILDRFRVKLCQTRHGLHRLAIREMSSYSLVSPSLRPTNNDNATTSTTKDICKRRVRRTREGGKRYNVEWILSDWHETNANIRWHDTDLIIATSGTSDVVIAFAGTAGPADAVTSIQTLEPASHSGLFDRRWGGGGIDDATNSSTTATSPSSSSSSLEGNIHRGYLNAYARVMRGNIRRLEYDYHDDVVGGNRPSALSPKFFTTLDDYYNECMTMQGRMNASIDREDSFAITAKKTTNRNNKKRQTKKQRGGHQDMCRSSGYRLMDILRNVTTSALRSGRNVHIVGHSLAGALATIHALDVAMNYDSVTAPMDRLHLWTFGAPEMADSLFFESAGSISQRLRDFLGDPRRHHRYVTQSVKNCDTDVVASITSNALNRGRAVRRLGGVRGDVVHMNEPTFLLDNATGVELHELRTYLRGISHSSSSPHGLRTDFPSQVKSWLGENT